MWHCGSRDRAGRPSIRSAAYRLTSQDARELRAASYIYFSRHADRPPCTKKSKKHHDAVFFLCVWNYHSTNNWKSEKCAYSRVNLACWLATLISIITYKGQEGVSHWQIRPPLRNQLHWEMISAFSCGSLILLAGWGEMANCCFHYGK